MMFSIRMSQIQAAIARLTHQKVVVSTCLYDLCRRKYLQTVLFFLQANKMYKMVVDNFCSTTTFFIILLGLAKCSSPFCSFSFPATWCRQCGL